MNKSVWLLTLGILFFVSLSPAQEKAAVIQEKVAVVNVEVPVRVLFEGRPIADLNKEEFKIYEGGKLQLINGFYSLRKTIAATAPAQATPISRYFVFVFRITNYNEALRQACDYLFKKILLPSDQLLLMVNDQSKFYEKLNDLATVQGEVEEWLKQESQNARNNMVLTLKHIEQEIDLTKFLQTLKEGAKWGGGSDFKRDVLQFLSNYLDIWKSYKKAYLTPQVEPFYEFANYLEKIDAEKWVINFYQLEMFPKIVPNSSFYQSINAFIDQLQVSDNPEDASFYRIISNVLNEINKEINFRFDFPTEEVSKLFYKVNATFHSLFFPTFRETQTVELEYQHVANDVENCLRQITEKTGGTLKIYEKSSLALADISQKEDIVYMLTYAPENPKKVGKIKVTVDRKKCQVLYDDNMRADYIAAYFAKQEAENPVPQIQEMTFNNKQLSLLIGNYRLQRTNGNPSAKVNVRIRVYDEGQRALFDQNKDLQTKENTLGISLNFSFLPSGRCSILVDVFDHSSGKKNQKTISVNI